MNEYKKYTLTRSLLNHDPLDQFSLWFEEARNSVKEPEAMALATASIKGVPSCRMVLLKSWDKRGFVFFTNSKSRKGQELSQNPQACATFYWKELERQVIIEGTVAKIAPVESNHYFASRSRDSQIGAWASNQGQIIKDREELIGKFHEVKEKYKDQLIPRPSYWEGYCLSPRSIEFWQGREGRLHDRFHYQLENEIWSIKRLSP